MTELRVLDEIEGRIAGACHRSAHRSEEPVPPLLALGTSERVGSNWFMDTLRELMPQHNEPFRQQISSDHPLSALNPDPADLETADLGPLGHHWLTVFAVGKYARTQQMVKETNLFFSWSTLLRLFPEAPVVVLSRSPIGVAGSFARGDLWRRWRYGDRYAQMVAMTRDHRRCRWAPLVPDDAPAEPIALARLITLNTVLLAESLTGREHAHVAYEQAVIDHGAAMRQMAELLPAGVRPPDNAGASVTPAADDTFATTTAKSELTAVLDPHQADLVRGETARCIAIASHLVAPETTSLVSTWLSGHDLYRVVPPFRPAPKPRSGPVPPPGTPPVTYTTGSRTQWRNLLVSNAEFCRFLNVLHAEDLRNNIGGTHLLATEMPHERGGRLHFDAGQGR